MASRRRSNDLIALQILRLCLKGASKTRVMYQANLNYFMVKSYLDNLTRNGFIVEIPMGSRVVFKTTDKGMEWKEKFERLQSTMEGLYA